MLVSCWKMQSFSLASCCLVNLNPSCSFNIHSSSWVEKGHLLEAVSEADTLLDCQEVNVVVFGTLLKAGLVGVFVEGVQVVESLPLDVTGSKRSGLLSL